MNSLQKSCVTCVAFAAITVAACSEQNGNVGAQGGGASNPSIGSVTDTPGSFGTVSAHLDLGGASVYSLNWTIANSKNTYTGITTVGDAQSFEFVQGGIAFGIYTLTLSGADNRGDPCSGTSGMFGVAPGHVSQVTLRVTCTYPIDATAAADVTTGTIEVDAGFNLVKGPPFMCPGINSLSISPAELAQGQLAELEVATTGSPPAPVIWSVSPADGGTFDQPTSPITSFTCASPPSAPQVTITVSVPLPDGSACAGEPFTTQSALVNCEPSGTVTGNDGGTPHCVPSATGPAGLITGNSPNCTPTEEQIYLDKGQACLSCLLANFCLDDQQGDTNQECGDMAGQTAVAGSPAAGEDRSTLCLADLHCMMTSVPDCASIGVSFCYCGTSGGDCSNPSSANGPCVAAEQAALETRDVNPATNFFQEVGVPVNEGEIANSILNCGHAVGCSSCYE